MEESQYPAYLYLLFFLFTAISSRSIRYNDREGYG
jgi:hypothetical protein